jgi:hypothetical protein
VPPGSMGGRPPHLGGCGRLVQHQWGAVRKMERRLGWPRRQGQRSPPTGGKRRRSTVKVRLWGKRRPPKVEDLADCRSSSMDCCSEEEARPKVEEGHDVTVPCVSGRCSGRESLPREGHVHYGHFFELHNTLETLTSHAHSSL